MLKNLKKESLDYKIDDFMFYCQQKDLRIKTIASYESTLRLFSRYVKDKHTIERVEEITGDIVKAYITYTKERGKYTFVADKNTVNINHPSNRSDYDKKISITTINNYIRNIKVFFNYLEEEGIIKNNPCKKIKQFKNTRKAKPTLTDNEFKRLLQNIDVTKFHEFRDYIIIQLIYDTGARLSETLAIEVKDVNLDRRAILLPQENTKSRKDRYVFFSQAMANQLKRWIAYKDRYLENDLLFCTRKNTSLSIHNFEKNFKTYCERISLEDVTAHTLRNAFGRSFLLSGGGIHELSRILGHSSVVVTEQAYADLTDEDIRNVYNKYSPIQRIKGKK